LPSKATNPAKIEALLFDTFGTVVDWQSYLARRVADCAARHGLTVDAEGFVKQWRSAYLGSLAPIIAGKRTFVVLDVLLREGLDSLLEQARMESISAEEREALVAAWHTIPPWPDSVAGLTRLKTKFIIGTLSNGSTRMLTDMARASGLPWDVVFGGDTFRRYKPDEATYLGAAALLAVKPASVVMVAAHNADLAAARSHGLRTAFIERPTEDRDHADWDYVTDGIDGLATQMLV
jgi:2-haloacid dehalogenase